MVLTSDRVYSIKLANFDMKYPFEKYYQNRPMRAVVDELSDARLNVDRDREKVNALVMSLVVQYLGEYMAVGSNDPRKIGEVARQKKAAMKAHRTRNQVTERLMMGAMKGDMEAGKSNDDFPGLDCLMDTASTAALFKEVAFEDRFMRAPYSTGLDLGSGSGILTLATAIAGRRSGARSSHTVGLDRESASIARSTLVVSRLLQPNEFVFKATDIRVQGLIAALYQGMPLSLWVSETIQELTPEMEILHGELVPKGDLRNPAVAFTYIMNSLTEPYFEVLANTLNERPSFEADVKKSVTAMFPDLVNRSYRPDSSKGGTLKLRTSPTPEVSVPLPKVGGEFFAYEQPVPEVMQDPRWMRFPAKVDW